MPALSCKGYSRGRFVDFVQAHTRIQRRDFHRVQDSKSGTRPTIEQRSSREEHCPLKIALVTSSYNYISDGVALTLNRLVAHLERQGVEVLVVAPVGKVPAFIHDGTVIPVPSVALPSRP